jgi:hypothetical protein
MKTAYVDVSIIVNKLASKLVNVLVLNIFTTFHS